MDQSRDLNNEQSKPKAGDRPETTGASSTYETPEAGRLHGVPGAAADGNPTVPGKTAAPRKNNELVEWIKALAIAAVLVLIIRWLLVSPFIVDGSSMEPNFWDGERIIVNKVLYDIREPKAGEVIVFHVPEEGRDYIKRVIATPGDTVQVDGDTVYVNGEAIEEPYLQETYEEAHAAGALYNERSFSSDYPNSQFQETTVPEGELFVLGDNRPDSKDSRMIGFVSQDEVVGRAELIFWPLNKIQYIGRGW
ncbi:MULTISPECIES: signal peptidase I [Cohnella]|uniref:signal peptidase I n=1 Tax=Cohnella TaxID=329857 RepID=UPI0009BB2FEB|nr:MULTISPECIES: signal peptidase I [Cohnella]MBN2983577.1 signal peptidase I [Cohnella algarum]